MQIGALHRVLGIVPVLEDAPCGAEQPLVVALGDEPHRLGIARFDQPRQRSIFETLIIDPDLRAHVQAPPKAFSEKG